MATCKLRVMRYEWWSRVECKGREDRESVAGRTLANDIPDMNIKSAVACDRVPVRGLDFKVKWAKREGAEIK